MTFNQITIFLLIFKTLHSYTNMFGNLLIFIYFLKNESWVIKNNIKKENL